MYEQTATAIANPNIAFIKYWGNCDPSTRNAANGSISMNLGGLVTKTSVTFDPSLVADQLILAGSPASGATLQRVVDFLEEVRRMARVEYYAHITSENNFPMGAGIASSASAFAALSLAASKAAGLELNQTQLSQLARTGSGSACRSVPSGFVEWKVETCDDDSGAESIAPPEHWDIVDCIAIISHSHKSTGSTEGHALAYTSLFQQARVNDAPRRLEICRNAILERDFETLAEITEFDSNLMHAVIMTSTPPILYWQPATITIMQEVRDWRRSGLPVFYTIDAGPNVHVICPKKYAQETILRLEKIPGVQRILSAYPGDAAYLVND